MEAGTRGDDVGENGSSGSRRARARAVIGVLMQSSASSCSRRARAVGGGSRHARAVVGVLVRSVGRSACSCTRRRARPVVRRRARPVVRRRVVVGVHDGGASLHPFLSFDEKLGLNEARSQNNLYDKGHHLQPIHHQHGHHHQQSSDNRWLAMVGRSAAMVGEDGGLVGVHGRRGWRQGEDEDDGGGGGWRWWAATMVGGDDDSLRSDGGRWRWICGIQIAPTMVEWVAWLVVCDGGRYGLWSSSAG
ncbi:hypothetical protein Dimus_034082 [Dionaea muscipula]